MTALLKKHAEILVNTLDGTSGSKYTISRSNERRTGLKPADYSDTNLRQSGPNGQLKKQAISMFLRNIRQPHDTLTAPLHMAFIFAPAMDTIINLTIAIKPGSLSHIPSPTKIRLENEEFYETGWKVFLNYQINHELILFISCLKKDSHTEFIHTSFVAGTALPVYIYFKHRLSRAAGFPISLFRLFLCQDTIIYE